LWLLRNNEAAQAPNAGGSGSMSIRCSLRLCKEPIPFGNKPGYNSATYGGWGAGRRKSVARCRLPPVRPNLDYSLIRGGIKCPRTRV
jgi:hypothetical protein